MAIKPAKQAKAAATKSSGNKLKANGKQLVRQAKAAVRVEKKQQTHSHAKGGNASSHLVSKKRRASDAAEAKATADKSAKRLKKELKQKRQARDKPNALKVQEAVASWEKIRASKTSAQEKSQLIEAVLKSFKGSLSMVALSAKASRVIQACLKHGNTSQRETIIGELETCIVDLCKDKYAHFLAVRMFDNASKAEKSRLIKALQVCGLHIMFQCVCTLT